jgi:hypothetical protein
MRSTQGDDQVVTSLELSLDTVSIADIMSDGIQFEALSYVWGDLSRTYPILCDGKILQIHHNLHQALPYLARRPSKLPLWIDALCINQLDEKEKVVQIRLMTQIYKCATHVWAWLGTADDPGATEAVEVIIPAMSGSSGKVLSEISEDFPENEYMHPHEIGLPSLSSPGWHVFSKIVHNAWFSRLWVVQEITLAHSLSFLYGDRAISLEALQTAIERKSKLIWLCDEYGKRLDNHSQLDIHATDKTLLCRQVYLDWQQYGGSSRDTLVNMIGVVCTYTTSHQCRDPRDRVLALLGLVGPEYSAAILFDETTSAADLYVQFVQFLFSGKHELRQSIWQKLLSNAVHLRLKGQTLPSWCPDLDRCEDLPTQHMLYTKRVRPFCASSKARHLRVGQSPRELIISGTKFDQIEAVGMLFTDIGKLKQPSRLVPWFTDFLAWEEAAFALCYPLLHGQKAACHTSDTGFSLHDYIHTLFGGSAEHIVETQPDYDSLKDTKSTVKAILAVMNGLGLQR